MLWMTLIALAFADGLVVDARVPVEVHLDGKPIAELYYPARLEFAADAGEANLILFINGRPQTVTMEIPEEGRGLLVVGRTGVTTGQTNATTADSDKPATVQVRATGREHVRLTVDKVRTLLAPGATLDLSLTPGEHRVELSNADGTIRYATGLLDISGGDSVIMQISEGRLPEIVADASHFVPTRH